VITNLRTLQNWKKRKQYKVYQIYKKKKKKGEFEYLAINSNFKFDFFSCCISLHVTPLSSPYSPSLCHIMTPKVSKVSNFNKTRKWFLIAFCFDKIYLKVFWVELELGWFFQCLNSSVTILIHFFKFENLQTYSKIKFSSMYTLYTSQC
jgi:hypothetical protein